MRRILIFIAFLVSIVSLISCSNNSSSSGPGGVNPGFPSDIQLLPTLNIAQTNSDIFFKARVLDGNGRPVSGVAVTFTNISPIGTINAARAVKTGTVSKSSTTVVNTNSLGFATVRVFSSTPGFVTVQSEVNAGTGHVRDKKTVYFSTYDFSIPLPPTPPPPPPPTLELAVDGEDADTIFDETEDFNLFETADDDEVIARATVLDDNGDPAKFVDVTFGADSAEASFPEGSTKKTDSNGQAQVRVKVDPALKGISTIINITASAIVDGKDAFDMVTLFLPPISSIPIAVGNVSLNATPAQVAPSGTSTIDAYVTVLAGGAVPDGTTVNFTAAPATGTDPDPCGFVIPFAQTTGGKATVTFTAPASFGTCTITGTVAGVNGSVNVVVSNALFIMPASQTISAPAVSDTATYNITGGTAPYTAFSSNPGVATVGVAGSTLTATVASVPTADTTVTITVYDNVGASKTATLILDVAPVGALTVIPATQTIDPNITPSADYTVIGGTGPYTAFSSIPSLVTVPAGTFAGPTLTATVASVPAVDTTVTITVYDSIGASKTATLILDVPSDPLKVIPPAQTITNPAVNDTADYTVIGGTGSYTAFSANPGLVSVTAGTFTGTLTATVEAVPSSDTTVAITIYDTAGSSVSASLVLDTGSPSPLLLSPSSVTVTGFANTSPGVDSNSSDDVSFTITGGTGDFSMYSNNNAVILSLGDLGAGVSTFVVDPDSVSASTTVTITVQDSLGATDTSTVTVTPPTSSFSLSPSTISVIGGDSVTVYMMGGTGPYETFTDDVSGLCAPAPGGGSLPDTATSFVVNPGASCSGTFTITLLDSIGKAATFKITVTPLPSAPSPVLAITLDKYNVIGLANPDVNAADNVTFTVTNGTAPYVVTSNNPSVTPSGTWSVASATTDVNNVSVVTPVTFTVVDNAGAGASATVLLNVFPQTTGLTISVNKPDVIGLDNGLVTTMGQCGKGTGTGTCFISAASCTVDPDCPFFPIESCTPADSLTACLSDADCSGIEVCGGGTGNPPPDNNTADDVTFYVSGGVPPYVVSAGGDNTDCVPNGPWILPSNPDSQIIDPDDTPETVTLTVTDDNGALATTTFKINP